MFFLNRSNLGPCSFYFVSQNKQWKIIHQCYFAVRHMFFFKSWVKLCIRESFLQAQTLHIPLQSLEYWVSDELLSSPRKSSNFNGHLTGTEAKEFPWRRPLEAGRTIGTGTDQCQQVSWHLYVNYELSKTSSMKEKNLNVQVTQHFVENFSFMLKISSKSKWECEQHKPRSNRQYAKYRKKLFSLNDFCILKMINLLTSETNWSSSNLNYSRSWLPTVRVL